MSTEQQVHAHERKISTVPAWIAIWTGGGLIVAGLVWATATLVFAELSILNGIVVLALILTGMRLVELAAPALRRAYDQLYWAQHAQHITETRMMVAHLLRAHLSSERPWDGAEAPHGLPENVIPLEDRRLLHELDRRYRSDSNGQHPESGS